MRGERALRSVGLRAASLVFRTPLYHLSLRGGGEPLIHDPQDPWPADAAEAQRLLSGVWLLPGGTVESALPPWLMPLALADRAALHGFGWLGALRGYGSDEARALARAAVSTWLDRFENWSDVAWSAAVIGERLTNWLGCFHFFAASARDDFRTRVLVALQKQSRHLMRLLPGDTHGADLIVASAGLALAGHALAHGEPRRALGLALLETALARQILADGSHSDRRPSQFFRIFRALVTLRTALRHSTNDVPDFLQNAIDRMAPMLRLLRLGDGGLVGFNGSSEGSAVMIDKALALSDARGRALRRAPYGGFERLQAGRGIALLDAGGPPPAPFDEDTHAGIGSFEFSFGRDRMIVSCGGEAAPQSWQAALRQCAARSAAQIEEREPIAFGKDGRVKAAPASIHVERLEAKEGESVTLSHDGFGMVARRILFLAASGEDLRGEDGFETDRARLVTLRFHLHPDVQASPAQDGGSVLVRLPGGSGWRFRASAADIALEDSIYCGRRRPGAQARRSQQIVVRGQVTPGHDYLQWAFQRERKSPG
jgi:uncharacterized heparinase superfamily protein